MKKSLLIFAAAAMVACSTEDVVRLQDPGMISFEASWVENATRADVADDPSTTTESLTAFDVWGFMDAPEAKVFEGEDVTGSKGNFNYLNTQYWIPGHTYYFAALAPMNSANWDLNTANANTYGAGVLSFENVYGTEDLLYAATAVESPALGEDKTVMLTFSHLLSKVKFSFTNGFDNEFITFDVKNIRIVDAPKSGDIDLAVENWWDNNDWVLGTDKVELNFGDACEQLAIGAKQESAFERLTIPAAARSYEIKFDLTLYANGVQVYPLASEGEYVTKTVIAENIAFEMGKAYHFKSELNAKNFSPDGTEFAPIVFDLEEVKDWVTAETPDAQIEETEFRAAVALGGKVTLTKDIELTKSLIVPEGVSTVIDLNGFNIINDTTDETLAVGDGIVVYGDLTIEGEGTVQGLTRCVWARGNTGATVTINGGHFIGANGVTTEVIYASGNGKIVINGGTFEAVTEDNVSFAAPQYAVLNLHGNGAAGCDIVVYGGSFKNFDPANNISENPAHNFCAPGYYSSKVGDYYVVADAPVVATVADLQKKLDEAVDGDVIRLAADIEGDVVVSQKADVKVTIDGAGYNYAGVIVVDGKSATLTTAGITIKNVNFVADAISADACIRLGDGTNGTRYTCNVTVEGCTFDVPGAVGVKSYTGGDKNLVIKECTATANCHSLLQAAGIDGILVEKCTVNSKNGLNFNASTNVVINECNVDTKGYCARFGASSGAAGVASYEISNSSLKSLCDDGDAVIILRATTVNSTLNLVNTTLEGELKFTNAGAKVYVDGVLM